MENKIEGGLGELDLDLSYAHGWTASHGQTHTVEVSTYYDFGPQDESPPDQGLHGWAIFNAPTFLTQQYMLYAYDYNQSTGQGTYLNEDIYATSVGAAVPQVEYFELANPTNGAIAGLFQGLPVYPNSTDIPGWYHITDWNNGGAAWKTIFGDRSSPPVGTLNVGTDITQAYTTTDTTVNSSGNDNSFSVSAGASFDVFEGFSSGVTVGYEAEFGTETEVESTITTSVSCSLDMPIPPTNSPNYVRTMVIQPYWLQATSTKAPWIPSGYSGNLPWCITWNVLSYGTNGEAFAGMGSPPLSAVGTVNSLTGQATYRITDGGFWSLSGQGVTTPVPLTADEFNTALGASVDLNGCTFSTSASTGKWTRKGQVWTYTYPYRPSGSATAESFTLGLDFGRHAWSFQASSTNLVQALSSAGDSVRVELVLQGSWWLTQWLSHDIDTTWQHMENQASWSASGVQQLQGAYHSRTGIGSLVLGGHFPPHTPDFGDVQLVVNSVAVDFPLLATKGFLQVLQGGGIARYNAQGRSFTVNFGAGTWQASIQGNAFQSGMAPQGGALQVDVRVGGRLTSRETIPVASTTTLTYAAH